MQTVTRVFDLLDEYRLLPDYQLERRADIFFALYLVPFLSYHFNVPLNPILIPEFPVRYGSIGKSQSLNLSCKIDYLALSADNSIAYFIELKTTCASRRCKQDADLLAAQNAGLPALLEGVVQLAESTRKIHRGKYFQLLQRLQLVGLLQVPDELLTAPFQQSRQQIRLLAAAGNATIQIRYVQPTATADTPNAITFAHFAAWLETQSHPLATRFAASLRAWSN